MRRRIHLSEDRKQQVTLMAIRHLIKFCYMATLSLVSNFRGEEEGENQSTIQLDGETFPLKFAYPSDDEKSPRVFSYNMLRFLIKFHQGFCLFIVAAILSTEKLTNTQPKSNTKHIPMAGDDPIQIISHTINIPYRQYAIRRIIHNKADALDKYICYIFRVYAYSYIRVICATQYIQLLVTYFVIVNVNKPSQRMFSPRDVKLPTASYSNFKP